MSGELFWMSPMTPARAGHGSPGRRRITTPTTESRSSKTIAVVCEAHNIEAEVTHMDRNDVANPLGWSAEAPHAMIESRLPIPNPFLSAAIPSPRHVNLPFNLGMDRTAITVKANVDLLFLCFPGMTGFMFAANLFILLFGEHALPAKPWPLTVAGLPAAFLPGSPFQHPIPGPFGHVFMPKWEYRRLFSDRDYTHENCLLELLQAIREHFGTIGVIINSIMSFHECVVIVLDDRACDHSRIPLNIAGVNCAYVYEDDLGRPLQWHARRQKDPTVGNPDEMSYDVLQPGVRVTSGLLPHGTFFSTTSGCLVQDSNGTRFMTAASHGFPTGSGTLVYHPLPSNGRVVGELIQEIKGSDIALVMLHDDESYLNQTFDNSIAPSIHLKFLKRFKDVKHYNVIDMDTPDTGYISGVVQGIGLERVPCDDPHVEIELWIKTTWLYMGQERSADLPQGICGSPIYGDDGGVVSFFNYAFLPGSKMDGYCMATSAQMLIDRGYTMVQ